MAKRNPAKSQIKFVKFAYNEQKLHLKIQIGCMQHIKIKAKRIKKRNQVEKMIIIYLYWRQKLGIQKNKTKIEG